MSRILVLYYSTWGHVKTMAEAVAKGAAGIPGTEVTIKRVPELMPEDVARQSGAKLGQAAPPDNPQDLADTDPGILRNLVERSVRHEWYTPWYTAWSAG